MEASSADKSLEQRISAWRGELADGNLNSEDLDELQSHLEDSVNELVSIGLSVDESWLLALQRMGPCEELKNEFQKVDDSRGNGLNYLFSGALILFLSYGIGSLIVETISSMSNIGSVRISRTILLLLLLAGVLKFIRHRKKWMHAPVLRVFALTLLTAFLVLVLGFITAYEGPWKSRNKNMVFEKHPPGSALYQKELMKVFTQFGTENLYYMFKSYASNNGRHYLITEAIGRGFIAEFPIEITNSKHPIIENVIRVRGKSYGQVEMQGLKFDVKPGPEGTEFIFKDIGRFAD